MSPQCDTKPGSIQTFVQKDLQYCVSRGKHFCTYRGETSIIHTPTTSGLCLSFREVGLTGVTARY